MRDTKSHIAPYRTIAGPEHSGNCSHAKMFHVEQLERPSKANPVVPKTGALRLAHIIRLWRADPNSRKWTYIEPPQLHHDKQDRNDPAAALDTLAALPMA